MLRQDCNDGTSVRQDGRPTGHSPRLALVSALIMSCSANVVAEEFVDSFIREHRKGYHARPCGFDMDRDGVIGEQADTHVGDGRTADPDGDGVNEDLIYVDADGGSDETGKAPWTEIKHTGKLDHGRSDASEALREVQVFLLGAGRCLIDDVEVSRNAGPNLVEAMRPRPCSTRLTTTTGPSS